MKKFLSLVVLVILFLMFSIGVYFKNISAQETGTAMESKIAGIEKLDEILNNQKKIMQQIDELKTEVRARCTR